MMVSDQRGQQRDDPIASRSFSLFRNYTNQDEVNNLGLFEVAAHFRKDVFIFEVNNKKNMSGRQGIILIKVAHFT